MDKYKELLYDCINTLANYRYLLKTHRDYVGAEVVTEQIEEIKKFLESGDAE